VENNLLRGDKACETVKQTNESLKNKVRDKLANSQIPPIANAIINDLAGNSDTVLKWY
jgi:hypothetical protein